MKRRELLRTLKFVLFSISAGVIQIVSFTLLNELAGIPEEISNLIALVLSVLWNFTFNRRYTFQSASNISRAMLLVAGYYCVFTPVSVGLMYLLNGKLGWNEYLVEGMTMVLNLVTEFLFQRFVVYRNSLDTNQTAQAEK